jgi:tetratricopeptide (TPR) repeat protein/TolB-like protein
VIRLRIFAVLAAILAISIVRAAAQQSLETTAPPADSAAVGNKVILVMPFQNTSKAPGLEWIGEAFSEVLGQQIQSPSTFVISREDRLHAFDRVGIPASAQLSRATLLRIAQQMDVDYVVLGSYTYDGNVFSTKAQVLDMRRLHLLPSVAEAGSLLQVIDIQAATSWDVMCQIQPGLVATKQDFVAETKDIRLDALENYVRGIVASDNAEKIRRLKEAVRLNPNYSVAMLQLGRTYFEQRDYQSSMNWFSKVPLADKHAAEANFFLGLSAFYGGNIERAADAFRFVAARLPLTEVYNNLGVVEARRGKSASVEYLERAVQADPSDPDYHFNLALSLARVKDIAAAVRQLKETLTLRPADTEAKAYLGMISGNAASIGRVPIERIKRNYDEASFRQLAFAIENAEETQMAHSNPKKHAALHVDLGKQQLRQGFYEEARDNFRKALALDADNIEAHVGLASAQIALNDLSGARSELDLTLRSKPNPDAYVALGQLNLKENKLDAANEAVAQALRLEPANSAALQLKQQLAGKLSATLPQNQ